MLTVTCPVGREYVVVARRGRRLLLRDVADGFTFTFGLTDHRQERGWRLTGHAQQETRRNHRSKGNMRIELTDEAGTGFRFELNTETELVEVTIDQDGEVREVAELTLEQADRWRTGKARLHRNTGLVEPVSAAALLGDADGDAAFLEQLGIEAE